MLVLERDERAKTMWSVRNAEEQMLNNPPVVERLRHIGMTRTQGLLSFSRC